MGKGNLIYIIFYGAALLVLMAMPFAFGEDVSTSVAITGVAPSVGSLTTSDNVALSSCGTVMVFCDAVISDSNGWNDIDNVNATLWDDATANEGDADNNNNHYTNSTCRLYGGSGSNVNAECNFTLQYYANPANWTCVMYANDTTGNVDNNSVADVTLNTLRALNVSDTINFGSLSPGGTSTDDVNNTVTNCGNAVIDLNLSGTNLTNASASVANITVGNVKYNVTNPGQDYTANMTSLTLSSVTRTEFSLAKRTTTPSNQTTFWKISIPASIENLIFTGAITFMAVADT